MVRETADYFNQMSSTIPADLQDTWLRQISSAETRRKADLSVMDILGAHDTQQRLPANSGPDVPPAPEEEWLHLALSIEERQYVVLLELFKSKIII
jgi:hypothetical protein